MAKTAKFGNFFTRVPWWAYLLVVVALIGFVYSLLFLPKTVAFSYSQPTCTKELVLLPGIQQVVGSDQYNVEYEGVKSIAGQPILASSVCFKPQSSPETGPAELAIAPFGSVVGRQAFTIDVPPEPSVKATAFAKPVPTTKPLEVALDQPDSLHDYSLVIAKKAAPCQLDEAVLNCQIEDLSLKQSTSYDFEMKRQFGNETATVVEKGTIKTLKAVKIAKTSVKNNQTIYSMPRKFSLNTDKPLKSAKVELKTGDQVIDSKVIVKKQTISVVANQDLPREKTFRLVVSDVEANDNSTLLEPYQLSFKTSGGPKVSNVSVGSSDVATNAQIIVTFDQPLKKDLDSSKIARVKNATATVSRYSASQLVFNLSAKDCTKFSLHIDKGLASDVNLAKSTQDWRFDSRTTCGTSSVIGYSVQGRPIVAYSFGSGSSTILFTGGIHGNELSSQQTMQGWVDYLKSGGAQAIPGDKKVVVVPNTNPDGIAMGARNNARNVNLGRNFDTADWKADTDTPGGILKNGGGKSPGSEPETKALMNLTRQLQPRLEVSFHSQGYLVGANNYGDAIRIGNIYASTVGYRTMFHNAEEVMGYSITGEYEMWMAEKLGIPAILIELPSHHGNYFQSQKPALLKMLNV